MKLKPDMTDTVQPRRKRGRPNGANGPAKTKTRVQKFKPRHDQVVMLHLSGYNHAQIAELTGYSPQRVYELLTDPIAVQLIEQGRKKVMDTLMDNIDGKLAVLANKSIDNIGKTVNADIPIRHPAKRHQDKMGLELLKMIGYGAQGQQVKPEGSVISNEVADRLANALEKSNRVREIVVEAEVISESAA